MPAEVSNIKKNKACVFAIFDQFVENKVAKFAIGWLQREAETKPPQSKKYTFSLIQRRAWKFTFLGHVYVWCQTISYEVPGKENVQP